MRPAIVVVIAVAVALAQSSRAFAQAPPPWADRAMRIVARVVVPERDDITSSDPDKIVPEQRGGGFFVGAANQVVFFVTAGHVIWPEDVLTSLWHQGRTEKVSLHITIELPDCRAHVPAVADSEHVSPKGELDVAVVTINLGDIPNHVGNRCRDVIARLPRHIVDPDVERLVAPRRAWLFGPGDTSEGISVRAITFVKTANDGLRFGESPFTPGDSGSPVFSDSGHILGMAVKKQGGATTKFTRILWTLDNDWTIPTNLAGSFSMLRFRDRHKGARLSIDGGPDVSFAAQHPAPLGKQVALRLRIDDRQEVTGIAQVRKGADMECDVALSWWVARHRREVGYTTLGLALTAGATFAVAMVSQRGFEDSPSRDSYDRVRLFNAFTLVSGSAALLSLGATAVGHVTSDTNRLTCREVTP